MKLFSYANIVILVFIFTSGCSLTNNSFLKSQPDNSMAGNSSSDYSTDNTKNVLINGTKTYESSLPDISPVLPIVIEENLDSDDLDSLEIVSVEGTDMECDKVKGCAGELLNETVNNGEAPIEANRESQALIIPKKPIHEHKERGQNTLDTALEFINASQEYWSEGHLDIAIETLDEAYALVVSVDTDVHPQLIQQKEDLRFMISRRILEIYASRYTATNGNHNEIPLTMNEHVAKEIKRFQGPEKKFFEESYRRSGKYMDKILVALKESGLPEDLAWLPLIESGFKVRALSRARALGLWQFIPSTGYKFGLKRDTWIDMRLDPEKATAAAIAYLKELHQIFGDWTTVLAAYNCGEGRVLRKIRNQKINYLDNFWDLYQQLPRETARYVPRFLATLHILKDPEKYGLDLGEKYKPVFYEEVSIEKPVQLKVVASKIDVSQKELIDLNPELRHKATPPTKYTLKVPQGKGNVFYAHLNDIPKWTPPKSAYVYHKVRSGESLSLIARRYRTSVSKIVRANNLRTKHFIRAGQKLKIPLRGTVIGQSTYASSKEKLLPGGKYRVKKGDSLWLIAKKFKTNTKSLQQINELRTTRLRVGQVLIVTR